MAGATWFAIFSAVLTVCGTVVALVLAFIWRKRSYRAFQLVILALGLRLVGWLVRTVVMYFLVRNNGPNQMAIVSLAMGSLQTLFALSSLLLLVGAAFVDREPRARIETDVYLPGDDRPARKDANPYHASG